LFNRAVAPPRTPNRFEMIEAGDRPYSLAVGDFNGDGLPDLAVANGSNDVSVLINDTRR